jgi:hypothetical protein
LQAAYEILEKRLESIVENLTQVKQNNALQIDELKQKISEYDETLK